MAGFVNSNTLEVLIVSHQAILKSIEELCELEAFRASQESHEIIVKAAGEVRQGELPVQQASESVLGISERCQSTCELFSSDTVDIVSGEERVTLLKPVSTFLKHYLVELREPKKARSPDTRAGACFD